MGRPRVCGAVLAAAGLCALLLAGAASAPAASAAESRLLFTTYRDGMWSLYALEPSDQVTKLIDAPGGGFEGQGVSSPDGRRIAYVCENFDLCVMNADGTSKTRLTTSGWPQTWDYVESPTWSPDGGRIAFTSNRSGKYRIYVIKADGTGLTQLAGSGGEDLDPTWSPDGSRIAFIGFKDGGSDLWLMKADGTGPIHLTRTEADEASPRWSPDGTLIAYQSTSDDETDVFRIRPDGTDEDTLADFPSNAYSPSWAPDSQTIAFEGVHDGRLDAFSAGVDSGETANLTAEDPIGLVLYPSFQPPPSTATTAAPKGPPPAAATADGRTVATYVRWSLSVTIVDYTLPGATVAQARRTNKIFIAHDKRARSDLAALQPETDRGRRLKSLARSAFAADAASSQWYLKMFDALAHKKQKLARADEKKARALGLKAYRLFLEADDVAQEPY